MWMTFDVPLKLKSAHLTMRRIYGLCASAQYFVRFGMLTNNPISVDQEMGGLIPPSSSCTKSVHPNSYSGSTP
jgi:hypothetical protein